MGGSALHVPTQRLSAQEFHVLADALSRDLSAWLEGGRVAAIPAYRTKADFGDLDLLVESEAVTAKGGKPALQAWVEARSQAREFVANGPVLSFDHRAHATDPVGFQVDLILTPREEFDIALAYFAYNDLGNLIGRTAHRMGFSYGHRGLLYPVREGDHLLDTLQLSTDVDRILPFLGYEPARFHAGFDGLPDIFRYVQESTYFHPDIFLLENRNHASRVRDRKRKTYREFLEWIQEHPVESVYPWVDREDRPAREAEKAHFVALAGTHFPHFREALAQVEQRRATLRNVKTRFNAEQISAWTGRTEKDLGQLMRHLKSAWPTLTDQADWLAARSDEEVATWVRAQSEALAATPSVTSTPRSERRRLP
jgi:hypothetical protein